MAKSTLWWLVMTLVLLVSSGRGIEAQDDNRGPQEKAEARGETQEAEFVSGAVSSVGVDRFQIQKQDGTTITVMVNDQTRYRQGPQDIALEDLKQGDRVVARGRSNANEGFVAVVVRRLTEQESARFQRAGDAVFGEIVSLDNGQLKVHSPMQGERVVVVNDQTIFMKEGRPAGLKDLKVGDRILARGKQTNGQFVATQVMTGRRRFERPRSGAGSQGVPYPDKP